MKRPELSILLAALTGAGLAACSAPVRPDLPTIVSIDQWHSQTGEGFLRIDYRDNDPATLDKVHCELKNSQSHEATGVIDLLPALALDPYGTERLAFTLNFPETAADKLDYRLLCELTFGPRARTEKTRYHSTLYRIPAENGLYR